MNHIFQTSVLIIMECIELNWLCKHNQKDQKQPTSHSCTKLKVSIVKTKINSNFAVKVAKGSNSSFSNQGFMNHLVQSVLFNMWQWNVYSLIDCVSMKSVICSQTSFQVLTWVDSLWASLGACYVIGYKRLRVF